MVLNGEIYNYRELRQELREYPFRTATDTEVVLAAYLVWGESCVDHLVGMFAIAVWDLLDGTMRLFRDRFGKKPLYYAHVSGRFVFASEIKAILPHLRSFGVDREALRSYLAYSAPVPPQTMFEGVIKLPAGCLAAYDGRTVRAQRYYDVLTPRCVVSTEHEALEVLERDLVRAVDRRLVADVEIGVLLSGGLDSSLIAALAQRRISARGARLRTFSVGYEGITKHDERMHGRTVARHIGSDHEEVEIDRDSFLESLNAVVGHLDQPVNDAACVPTYHLSRALHDRQLKVALCGEGSDEIFLGYRKYASLIAQHGEITSYRTASESFRDVETCVLLGEHSGIDHPDPHMESWRSDFAGSHLSRSKAAWMTFVDIRQWVAEVLLPKVDSMGMAHSLELRSPYMDQDLVETALNIDQVLRFGDGSGKPLLKKIAAKYLPDGIVHRRKQGFGYPLVEWLAGTNELAVIREVADETGWFSVPFIDTLLDDFQRGYRIHHVWGLFVFAKWFKKYFGTR